MSRVTLRCWKEVLDWCKENDVSVTEVRPPTINDPWFVAEYEAPKKVLVKMVNKFWDGQPRILDWIEE